MVLLRQANQAEKAQCMGLFARSSVNPSPSGNPQSTKSTRCIQRRMGKLAGRLDCAKRSEPPAVRPFNLPVNRAEIGRIGTGASSRNMRSSTTSQATGDEPLEMPHVTLPLALATLKQSGDAAVGRKKRATASLRIGV